jgi:hypothetical protein
MAITQKNEYVIGSNNDLSNALLNIDLNRLGGDLTYLENDGGTLKVSVGSLIESQGSIYQVATPAETPTGTAQDGAYLFFDDSIPGFVWSNTAGTYDPTRGGIYDGSDRRQCRFRLSSATTYDVLVTPVTGSVVFDGDVSIDGNANINGTLDAPTLNTGQGDNELYAMDQNVRTTDDVTFSNIQWTGFRPYRSANVLTESNITENEIFDALAPFIPNVGDAMFLQGSYSQEGASTLDVYLPTWAERDSSTRIIVTGVRLILRNPDETTANQAVQGTFAIDDGVSDNYDAVSLSW